MTNLLKLGKKIFTVGVVSTTIFWSLGVAALVPAVASAATETDCAALKAGDMIKTASGSDIWVLNSDKSISYFASGDIFKSWTADNKYTFNLVSADCAKSLTPAGAVYPRPGTFLVKAGLSDTVYAVLPGNMLAEVSADAAKALYGAKYALSPAKGGRTITIDNATWLNFSKTIASAKVTEVAPTEGTLVKNGTKYYVVGSGMTLKEVTATGLTANRYQKAFAYALTSTSAYTMGTAVDAQDAMLSDTTQGMKNTGTTTVPGPVATVGNLNVSLAANTPASADVPMNTAVDFLTLNLSSNDADVNVTGLKLSAFGLGTAQDIDAVTIYSNGVRYGNSRDVDSNKVATINFTNPLVVKKGMPVSVTVKATVASTGHYALGLASAADVMASASVGGVFPLQGNALTGTNVSVGQLTFDTDGSLASVKLGDKAATLAKLKVSNNNVEDVALNSLILKRDSASTAADADFENLQLFVDGNAVTAATSLSSRYVTFNFTSPLTILKNGVKRFTVKGDVVGGASKALTLILDSKTDVSASGSYYHYNAAIVNNYSTGTSVSVTAGAVTIEKVNATVTKIKKDTTDNQFGSFKITVNSGKSVELSTMKLTVASTNDGAGSQIENVEVFLKNNNTVYDLTSSTGNGVYSNTSMGLVLNSGTTYEFVVRADTKSGASNGDYTFSIGNASTDLVMKETANDTTVTDVTPNSVSLNKVQVETASITFSKNALSSAYNAVVGTSDVEVMNFNVKAGSSSETKLTQLSFRDNLSTTTKALVSEFKLYKGTDLVKTVSANDLSSYIITFTDLNQVIPADQTVAYSLRVSLVNDVTQNGKSMKWELASYSAEETTKGTAVYTTDTTIDASGNGTVATNNFTSARTVTIAGYGSLNVTVDNTNANTQYDSWQLAGAEKVAVATFKLKANNEPVKVTKVKVVSSADLSSSVSYLGLYDAAGNEVASSAGGIGATTTTLDQDFTVTGEQSYTLKATFYKVGQDLPGALNVTSTFKLQAIEAEGASGHTLTAGGLSGGVTAGEIGYEGDTSVSTAASKITGVVASKMASVGLVSSYGTTVSLASKIFSGSAANAAIVAVTVPSVNNTNSDGTAVKLYLSNLKMKANLGGPGWTNLSATLERIGGVSSATSTSAMSTSTGYMTFGGLTGQDYQIDPGTTAYFLVKATPTYTTSNPGDTSLSLELDKLNGTSASNNSSGANFTWLDRSDASAKYDLRIPGTNSVSGVTISN